MPSGRPRILVGPAAGDIDAEFAGHHGPRPRRGPAATRRSALSLAGAERQDSSTGDRRSRTSTLAWTSGGRSRGRPAAYAFPSSGGWNLPATATVPLRLTEIDSSTTVYSPDIDRLEVAQSPR
nr:hypothetical protein [uncultured Actinoplanes sp.]